MQGSIGQLGFTSDIKDSLILKIKYAFITAF